MVRDYETPDVPPSWARFAREWFERIGFEGKELKLTCALDRYGSPIVLRVYDASGAEIPFVRRSSDMRRAAERRARFLAAVQTSDFTAIRIDIAGYYIGEGAVHCPICSGSASHEEWQHLILRDLLRVKNQVADAPGLTPEEADDAENRLLDAKVSEHLDNAAS